MVFRLLSASYLSSAEKRHQDDEKPEFGRVSYSDCTYRICQPRGDPVSNGFQDWPGDRENQRIATASIARGSTSARFAVQQDCDQSYNEDNTTNDKAQVEKKSLNIYYHIEE